jgi:hypothetical protein
MLYDIAIDGRNYRLELDCAEGRWSCRLNGRNFEVDAVLARPDVLSLRVGNLAYEVKSAIPALCAAEFAPEMIRGPGR